MTDSPTYRFTGAAPTVHRLDHPAPRVDDGRGCPKGVSKEASTQREDLQDYLLSTYPVGESEAAAEVSRLSIVERTWLELEMQDRSKMTGHVSDYDPLA